ncbi:hypothetical protein [Alkalibacillus salilacus]|uniref:DUF3139 domain-containing protein n=1 Tax=Alkalibacillus salilacus TaxID=284582 RepID=A0ABT9VJ26_9BACI|nr:hypothetical protein [Alkalibacillus salilacus]MDQ0160800.1 hypothetical protein [Alkalibacillus salilacus]
MKKSFAYLVLGCGLVAIIGYFTLEDTFVSDDNRSKVVQEARKFQKTSNRKETEKDTMDVYDEDGDYVITVPIELWTENQEEDISFWRENREKFIEEYDLPEEDPEGEVDWDKIED